LGRLYGQLRPVPHLHAPLPEEAPVDLQGVLGGLGGDVVGRVVVQVFMAWMSMISPSESVKVMKSGMRVFVTRPCFKNRRPSLSR
jgi:hypothetical protein